MWWMVAAMAAKAVLGQGAQIEVSKARNKAVIQQTAKQLNDIALQRAQSRDRTEVSLFNIQQQKLQAQSQVGLQAAASGTMGASVKDAVATVNTVAGRQEASVRDQQATQEEGFRLMTEKAVDSGLANMDMEDPYDKMFNSLLSVGASAAGQYAGNAASSTDSGSVSAGSGATAIQSTASSYDLWGSKGSSSVHTW
ncbi:internal virion protein [Klebsiella phage KP-Rio/2015]|uniref:Putative internal virion protein B n=1 Tax=Klebsiella phage KP-Rio/2015 TaxID=1904925 RepID=A0A1D8ES75_9CAUD|nr:internal virion protein [Klebsiella phage KP-Rio/2015]AOT23876.1 putative internal virion protein B [Klebsiella phage KP-Rio/2015]